MLDEVPEMGGSVSENNGNSQEGNCYCEDSKHLGLWELAKTRNAIDDPL